MARYPGRSGLQKNESPADQGNVALALARATCPQEHRWRVAGQLHSGSPECARATVRATGFANPYSGRRRRDNRGWPAAAKSPLTWTVARLVELATGQSTTRWSALRW